MTNDLINFVDMTSEKIKGNIASLSYDIDFTAIPVNSLNEKAPKFRLMTKTPRGRDLEIGAIWEKSNKDDKLYYQVSVNTGHSKVYGNLGRYPGQDDASLYAIIFND